MSTIRVEWCERCWQNPDGTIGHETYDPPRVEFIDAEKVRRIVAADVGVIGGQP